MYAQPIIYDSWDDFLAAGPNRQAPHIDLAGDWGEEDWGVTLVPGTGEIVRMRRGGAAKYPTGSIQVLTHIEPMDNEEAHRIAQVVESEIPKERRRNDGVWAELCSRAKNARSGFYGGSGGLA